MFLDMVIKFLININVERSQSNQIFIFFLYNNSLLLWNNYVVTHGSGLSGLSNNLNHYPMAINSGTEFTDVEGEGNGYVGFGIF